MTAPGSKDPRWAAAEVRKGKESVSRGVDKPTAGSVAVFPNTDAPDLQMATGPVEVSRERLGQPMVRSARAHSG